jgi:circadian clock protein KaiB
VTRKRPGIAGEDRIVAAPTLMKKLPLPLRRFIGDLSDKEQILVRLNLISEKPEANLS